MFTNILFNSLLASTVIAAPVLEARTKYPKVSTLISSQTQTLNYGSARPVEDIVDALHTQCPDYECNLSFDVQSKYASLGGDATSLTVSVTGTWANEADGTNPKGVLIKALGQVVGSMVVTKTVPLGAAGAHGSSGSVIEHHAQINSGITRQVIEAAGEVPAVNGFLSISVKADSSGSAACGAITGALGALLGPIGELASIFFGVVSPAICAAA